MNFNIRHYATLLGGEASGNQVACPGPGHSAADRSLSVLFDPNAPDGFVVHSFTGQDALACKDYVRSRLGWAKWEPKSSNGHAHPPRIVATYPYHDANSQLGYEVVRFSDKTFKHRRPDGRWGIKGIQRLPATRSPALSDPLVWPREMTRQRLWESYELFLREHHIKSRATPSNWLHRWFKKSNLLPGAEVYRPDQEGDRRRRICLPPLEVCRKAFEAYVGSHEIGSRPYDPRPRNPRNGQQKLFAWTGENPYEMGIT